MIPDTQQLRNTQHFCTRFYFSANAKEIIKLAQEKPIKLINKSFRSSDVIEQPSLTPLENTIKIRHLPRDNEERKSLLKQRSKETYRLTAWWLKQIHSTSTPLQERMTLFWHNHFTSDIKVVKWPQLMYRQNQLLRKHALGSFADLLKAIYKDPAMLIYLNGNKNTAAAANENFARELLELFTLGEGNYAEQDILSAAKAFTGWRYSYQNDEVVFSPKHHDQSIKHFLGHTGRFNADDIINILLDTPKTAEFIAKKFWSHFVSPTKPDQDYIQHWASLFRDSHYQIKSLLSSMMNSEPFWADLNRGTLIKSPIEMTTGLLNELELNHEIAYTKLSNINKKLGQQLFSPPDVKGWHGGKQWINNTTYVLRQQFIRSMTREHLGEMMQMNHFINELDINTIKTCLLSVPQTTPLDNTSDKKTQIMSLLSDPAYQLR